MTNGGHDTYIVGTAGDSHPNAWFAIAPTVSEQYPVDDMLQQGEDIWNYNMLEYGFWKWGDV